MIENIEAEVEAEVNFIYGTDYDLGDIVTVEKAKWNKVLNLALRNFARFTNTAECMLFLLLGMPYPQP